MLLGHIRCVLLTLPDVWCDSKGVAIMLVKFLMDSNEAWELKGLNVSFLWWFCIKQRQASIIDFLEMFK